MRKLSLFLFAILWIYGCNSDSSSSNASSSSSGPVFTKLSSQQTGIDLSTTMAYLIFSLQEILQEINSISIKAISSLKTLPNKRG